MVMFGYILTDINSSSICHSTSILLPNSNFLADGCLGSSCVSECTQDEGGGIPHRILDRVWEYSFTTVQQSPNFEGKLENSNTGTGMYQVRTDPSTRRPGMLTPIFKDDLLGNVRRCRGRPLVRPGCLLESAIAPCLVATLSNRTAHPCSNTMDQTTVPSPGPFLTRLTCIISSYRRSATEP